MATPPPEPPPPAALQLVSSGWVQRLARRLVRDPATAEDLAQEAWVAALERPGARTGGDVRAWRAWLAAVVRNLAREERRSRGRRLAREAAAARPEAEPAAEEALARVARQREVVEAVLALEEPLRTTIVLRWFEGLPPRRIAARQGVPVATVKSRLVRGHALLRRRLDRQHGGDGRAWALALLPLAAPPRNAWLPPALATPLTVHSIGALALNTPTKLVLAALPLAGLALWLQRSPSAPLAPPAEPAAHAAPPAELARVEQPPQELAPLAEPRRAEAAPEAPPAAAPEPASVSGRVVDLDERPVGGVELGLRGTSGTTLDVVDGRVRGSYVLWNEAAPSGPPAAVSDAEGRFRFAPEREWAAIVSVSEAWEAVYSSLWDPTQREDLTVVVAPCRALRGRIVDPDGAPLAGATLRLLTPQDLSTRIGASLDQGRLGVWEATAAADGTFLLERLPEIEGALLLASAEGCTSRQLAPPPADRAWLDVVLERAGSDGAWLEGEVVGPAGPLAGARVALRAEQGPFGTDRVRSVETDPAGRFRLGLSGVEQAARLEAFAPGFLPASFAAELGPDGRASWPDFLTLVLEAPACELRGVVREADGAPAAGHTVWLLDGSGIQEEGQAFATLLESHLAGTPDMRHRVDSDEAGRFVLGGLLARSYRLRVAAPDTALLLDVGPFEARPPGAGAAELAIDLPAGALWPELRGHVRTPDGEPVAARLQVEGMAYLAQSFDASGFVHQAHGAGTSTADDGSFLLARVPRQRVRLAVRGASIMPFDVELESLGERALEPLELVAFRRASLRIASTATLPEATAFSVLDASGTPLTIEIPQGGGTYTTTLVPLEAGRSPTVTVAESGTWLVLRSSGTDPEELARLPLSLTPGETTQVEL